MKVEIIYGPHTDEAIQKCYRYILQIYRRHLQEELEKERQSKNAEDKR